jgi:hypothetical protein
MLRVAMVAWRWLIVLVDIWMILLKPEETSFGYFSLNRSIGMCLQSFNLLANLQLKVIFHINPYFRTWCGPVQARGGICPCVSPSLLPRGLMGAR